MTVHYQALDSGGMRAAYLARPEGNTDQIVRAALKMQHTQARDPIEIVADKSPTAYIIDGPKAVIYHNLFTALSDTSYTVEVPKSDGDVVVGIRTGVLIDAKALEQLIQIALIDRELIPAGLVPIESKRAQIPASYLRTGL